MRGYSAFCVIFRMFYVMMMQICVTFCTCILFQGCRAAACPVAASGSYSAEISFGLITNVAEPEPHRVVALVPTAPA
jgi:hypothetical protein